MIIKDIVTNAKKIEKKEIDFMNYKDNNVISLYENNIAFHTFEIKRNLDKESFDKVFNYMIERYLCNNITKPNRKGYYMFWDFCDITEYKGVNVTLQRPAVYIKNKFFVYSLKIRVNPRLLIDYDDKENETNYFGIFKCYYDNILKLIPAYTWATVVSPIATNGNLLRAVLVSIVTSVIAIFAGICVINKQDIK